MVFMATAKTIFLSILLIVSLFPLTGKAEWDAPYENAETGVEKELHPVYDPWSYIQQNNAEADPFASGTAGINPYTGEPREESSPGLTDMVRGNSDVRLEAGETLYEMKDSLRGWVPAGIGATNAMGEHTYREIGSSALYSIQPANDGWKLYDSNTKRQVGESKMTNDSDALQTNRAPASSESVLESKINGQTSILRVAPH